MRCWAWTAVPARAPCGAGLQDWLGALSRDWCADDPAAVATLFVNGHVQGYSGQGQLPRHFVTRQKLALPAAGRLLGVHALGGAPPLLCLHRQVDDGMVREIWHGIVPQLRLLDEGAGEAAEPCLTLVFDREGCVGAWSILTNFPRIIPAAGRHFHPGTLLPNENWAHGCLKSPIGKGLSRPTAEQLFSN